MPSRSQQPTVPNTDPRYLHHFADRIAAVLISSSRADYDLGKMLDEVIRGHYYRHWPGKVYPTFGEWCWEVLHFREGKARAHHRIYTRLTAMGIEETSMTLTNALRLGWSKLVLVLQVARTEIQLAEWIDRITQHSMTETTLRFEIGQAKAQLPETAPEPLGRAARGAVPEGTVPMPDDGAGEPDEDAEAPKGKKKNRKKTADADADEGQAPDLGASPPSTPSKRFHKWGLVFEDAESMTIWKDALAVVEKRYPGIGNGKAAALMATHYLGSVPRDDEGGAAVEVQKLLAMIEATYGLKFQVVGDVTEGRTRKASQPSLFPDQGAASF